MWSFFSLISISKQRLACRYLGNETKRMLSFKFHLGRCSMFIFSYNNPFELVLSDVKYFAIIEYHAFKIILSIILPHTY